MKNARHAIIPVVTTAIVIGALAVTFYYKGDAHALKTAFWTARWGFAPLAVLAGLLVYPVKALRWRVILGPGQKARYGTLLSAIMIGFMANCIVSRFGELIRAAVMSIKGEMRTSAALASIALERVFDLCTVALFLLLALHWMSPSIASGGSTEMVARLEHAKVFVALLLVAAISFLVLLRLCPRWMTGLLARFTRVLPGRLRERVEAFLQTFLLGLDTLRTWRQVAAILLLSLVHWGLQVLFFLLAGYCFPDMGMTLPVALLIFAVVAFGVAGLPLPGYIGIYQIAVLAAGAIAGVHDPHSAQQAAWNGYSWIAWLLNIPFVILVGFIFLWKENLSLGQIRKQSAASQESGKSD